MKNKLIFIKNWLDLNLLYYKKVISFLLFFDSERDTIFPIFCEKNEVWKPYGTVTVAIFV